MQAALAYTGEATDTIALVSAPASLETGCAGVDAVCCACLSTRWRHACRRGQRSVHRLPAAVEAAQP